MAGMSNCCPRVPAAIPLHVCGGHKNNTQAYLGYGVFHHEHVCDISELAKVLSQLVLAGLPAEAPHEELAGGGVGGGGGPTRGLPLAPQLPARLARGGEGQPRQLVHRQPETGELGMWQGGGEGYGANTQGTGYSAAPRQQTVRMFLTHLEQGKSLFSIRHSRVFM